VIASALFFKATLLFYLLGTTFFLLHLWGRERRGMAGSDAATDGRWSRRFAIGVTAAGFLCHTVALATRIHAADYVLFGDRHAALSFVSWAMVLVFLFVEMRRRVHILGSFILPLAFLSLVSASALPNEVRNLNRTLKSAWLGVHTTLSLLGVVAFALAFVAGLMYLTQERLLKAKRFGPLYDKLPPLDLLDQWNAAAILTGFPLFTLGIISGALWSQYAVGILWAPDNPKQLLAIGIWVFYLITLHGRVTIGWRAKRAARLAVVGFAGVILIFLTLS